MKPIILYDNQLNKWLKFENPVEVIKTFSLKEVHKKLDMVEERTRKGFFAVGFISYNASPSFDSALKTFSPPSKFPLLCFYLFSSFQFFDFNKYEESKNAYELKWEGFIPFEKYSKKIVKIKDEIKKGNIYQVNYTNRLQAKLPKNFDSFNYFLSKIKSHKKEYFSYIECDNYAILSFSPELFFSISDSVITSKPMKGTFKRGKNLKEDRKNRQALFCSEKERAENVMICDMMRNDIGKIGFDLKVDELFSIETYPTILQMISKVSSKIKNQTLKNIFTALFPCASITGAPKVKATKIIAEIESFPRDIYTGAIGFITPEKRMQFSVAIRTIQINKKERKAFYGVGGGIVWDSNVEDEYQECMEKTKILEKKDEFSIIESLLWTKKNGYFLLKEHLRRLKKTAIYFNYELFEKKIKTALLKMTFSQKKYKVRILLNKTGEFKISKEPILKNTKIFPVFLASKPINSNNLFLYHKTTNRKHYEKEDDKIYLFYNEKGELTESNTSNIVLKIDKNFYTPFLSSGLLAGTFRDFLIKKKIVKQKKLKIEELEKAKKIYLINSVRKWQKVNFVKDTFTHNVFG